MKNIASLALIAFLLLAVVVVSISVATNMALAVQNQVVIGLVLLFALLIVVIAVPFFALINGNLPPNTFLEAFVYSLSRVPVIGLPLRNSLELIRKGRQYEATEKQMRGVHDAIDSLTQKRRQAEDWKQLHSECHDFYGLILVLRRGVIPYESQRTQEVLLEHWQNEASFRIWQFTQLTKLHDGVVKQELLQIESARNWFYSMNTCAKSLDNIIRDALTPEDIETNVVQIIHSLEHLYTITNELLKYLDGRLQKTIVDIESDVDHARNGFTQFTAASRW